MIIKSTRESYWLGIGTNNFEDKENDIITAAAHQNFVSSLSDGRYKEITGQERPDLFFYHIPVAIGDVRLAEYKDGFLFLAGLIKEDEFSQKIAELISETPCRMSHYVKREHYKAELEKDGIRYITSYYSIEFSCLPIGREANDLTEFQIMIPDQVRKWITDNWGSETLNEFESKLTGLKDKSKGRLSKMDENEIEIPPEEEEEVVVSLDELVRKALEPLVAAVVQCQKDISELQATVGSVSKAQKKLFAPVSTSDWLVGLLGTNSASNSASTIIKDGDRLATSLPIQQKPTRQVTGIPVLDNLIAGKND